MNAVTVGRQVHYYRKPGDAESGFAMYTTGPFAATIAYVHGPNMVNLAIIDHNGQLHSRTSVPLLLDRAAAAGWSSWCEWPPIQVVGTPVGAGDGNTVAR